MKVWKPQILLHFEQFIIKRAELYHEEYRLVKSYQHKVDEIEAHFQQRFKELEQQAKIKA